MSEISRLSAEQVRGGVTAGTTLLVCAYEDDAKFEKFKLEGAIPLAEFRKNAGELPKDRKIVFYCA